MLEEELIRFHFNVLLVKASSNFSCDFCNNRSYRAVISLTTSQSTSSSSTIVAQQKRLSLTFTIESDHIINKTYLRIAYPSLFQKGWNTCKYCNYRLKQWQSLETHFSQTHSEFSSIKNKCRAADNSNVKSQEHMLETNLYYNILFLNAFFAFCDQFHQSVGFFSLPLIHVILVL